ncbi:MAG: glycosyltransferase family 2 protein [Micropruina sp.]
MASPGERVSSGLLRDAGSERGGVPGGRGGRRPRQDYPAEQELVLALGASSDRTTTLARELAERDPRVRLVDNPANDIPVGLNRAIDASRHPIVVRVDAHAELPAGYTRAMVDLLNATGAVNVGGVMHARGRTPFQAAVARAYNSPWGLGGGQYHGAKQAGPSDSAYLGVFRREVLDEVGGYDETLRRAEDWELNSRIIARGHLVWYTPDIAVTYWPRATPATLRRQMFATGVWRGHLVRQQRTTPLKYLAPPAAGAGAGRRGAGGARPGDRPAERTGRCRAACCTRCRWPTPAGWPTCRGARWAPTTCARGR